ncbi:intracellular multiplication protein IcmG [Xanthomonas sacchari]|uniref:IcmG-like type IV secretion system protein n=1 Tax=Xanthomonas sacchari TaxID=56458 RepID=UPI002788877F|nr:IcmG-like type IV secretion system protein [Xanthomonas sacchari]MDQ1090707.1 intracellular multiplication protein IcmG [Xanthomonas sacchari]
MSNFNHDDALPGDDFNDEQSVFSSGGQAPAAPESDAKAKLAKRLLIGFVLLIVILLGWIGFKLMNRGSGAVDTLSIPVQDRSNVPMTGITAGGGTPAGGPAATPGPQIAGGQVAPPAAPPAATQQMEQEVPVSPALPMQQNPPAAAQVTQLDGARGSTEPTAALAETAVASQQTEQTVTHSAAQPGAQDELQQLKARVAELEQRVASLGPTGGAAKSSSREVRQAPRRSTAAANAKPKDVSTRDRVTAAALPKPDAAAPTGIQLKAVLEGRAWLQMKSGETVSVAPGDSIPGAGTVSTIDVERNEVRLSNGSTLR